MIRPMTIGLDSKHSLFSMRSPYVAAKIRFKLKESAPSRGLCLVAINLCLCSSLGSRFEPEQGSRFLSVGRGIAMPQTLLGIEEPVICEQ